MRLLRKLLDSQEKHFKEGRPLARMHPLFEAADTLFFSPAKVTRNAPHVRDGLDLKRMMGIVVVALMPCVFMALYNTGYQANAALVRTGMTPEGWRADIVNWLGLTFSPDSFWSCLVHGGLYFLPVFIVTFAAGGAIEVLFAIVRRHEVNEGFFVTGFLIPLIVPPTIPLWQVALGTAFGVLLGKEVFGGTGMNIFNPALVTRVFLFFAYPAEISGDAVWVAVDGYSGPTLMAQAMVGGPDALSHSAWSWWDAFLGFVPGSMGETSTLFCLLGAVLLIVTQVGSWRTMLSLLVGSLLTTLLLNALAGKGGNPYLAVPFWWHFVLGGWAFGAVFMATDPVSSAQSETGKYIYGFLIGVMAILIRVVNPAYPEGMMLAILFMNVFAPVIDHYVMRANIKRRLARNAATL